MPYTLPTRLTPVVFVATGNICQPHAFGSVTFTVNLNHNYYHVEWGCTPSFAALVLHVREA